MGSIARPHGRLRPRMPVIARKIDSHGAVSPAMSVGRNQLLLTEREAARLLNISPRTLWGLRQSGKIAYVRVGKCVRYTTAQLEAWIATVTHG